MGLKNLLNRIRGVESRSEPPRVRAEQGAVMGVYGLPSDSGITVSESSALGYSAYFACIRLVAGTIASLPRHVVRSSDNGKEKDDAHPVGELVNETPNPYMSGYSFWQTLVLHHLAWGNAYACIVKDPRTALPVELVPLLPDRTRTAFLQNGEFAFVTLTAKGEIVLRPDEVLHLPALSYDGIRGMSTAKTHANAIGLGLATEQYGNKFFKNGGHINKLIEHPGKLSPDALRNLKESAANWQGLENAHRIAILEEGMKLHEVGIPPEAAQFLETRRFQAVEICRIFGVPPSKLGIAEGLNYNNPEHQQRIFWQDTLLPLVTAFEQEAKRKLFTEAEQSSLELRFNADAILRADLKSRYEAYQLGRNAGFLNVNEIRRTEGLSSIDGGDAYLTPLNMTATPAVATPDAPARIPPQSTTTPPEKPKRSVDLSALSPLLDAAGKALAVKEGNAARTAARRSPDQFSQWADSFFAEHQALVRDAFVPILRAASALGATPHPLAIATTLAEKYIEEAKAHCLKTRGKALEFEREQYVGTFLFTKLQEILQ